VFLVNQTLERNILLLGERVVATRDFHFCEHRSSVDSHRIAVGEFTDGALWL
jgi:hypothetical protein